MWRTPARGDPADGYGWRHDNPGDVTLIKIPYTPNQAAATVVNLVHKTAGGGLADLRPMPRSRVAIGPLRSVYHYTPDPAVAERTDDSPVLLVPPLAAPALCFDLRRRCSLVEHLLATGAGRLQAFAINDFFAISTQISETRYFAPGKSDL